MHLKNTLIGAAVLALMLGSLLAPMLAAVPVAAQGDGQPQSLSDARKKIRVMILIEITNNTIERTLRIAEEYNITIPTEIQSKIEEARSLLRQAAATVDTDPDQAFELVKEAMRLARDAAVYVHSNLEPEVRNELKAKGLERAIENQLEFIEKVEGMIAKLESYNITVPEELKQRLEQARSILEDALSMVPLVENGTIPAAVVAGKIGDAKLIVASVLRDLNRGVMARVAFKARMVEAHVNCVARIVVNLDRAINKTIQLIEAGETEDAVHLVNATLRMTLHAINTTDRMIAIVITHNIGDENLTTALETLKAGLENVSQYLEDAYQALQDNDTATALLALEAAAEQIDETLSQVAPYLGPFRHRVEIMVRHVRQVRMRLEVSFERHMVRGQMMLISSLTVMKHRLERAYQAYQQGRISEEQWRQIAERALHQLELLERHLERLGMNRGPLANAIDQLQSWLLSTLG